MTYLSIKKKSPLVVCLCSYITNSTVGEKKVKSVLMALPLRYYNKFKAED